MEQPSTPIQALRAWLAAHKPGAELDGVPVRLLLEHFLLAQAGGTSAARRELKVLNALIAHWLKRLQCDIGSFPLGAVAVLQQQKKALVATHMALSELQHCLLALSPSQTPGQTPKHAPKPAPRSDALGRPLSWQRTKAFQQTRALRALRA